MVGLRSDLPHTLVFRPKAITFLVPPTFVSVTGSAGDAFMGKHTFVFALFWLLYVLLLTYLVAEHREL